jgi:hypothetical protein
MLLKDVHSIMHFRECYDSVGGIVSPHLNLVKCVKSILLPSRIGFAVKKGQAVPYPPFLNLRGVFLPSVRRRDVGGALSTNPTHKLASALNNELCGVRNVIQQIGRV